MNCELLHPVWARLRIDAPVRQAQPLHRTPVNQVLLHNLRGIFGLNMPVPDRFRIYHHGWAVLALIETAGFVDADCTAQPRSLR